MSEFQPVHRSSTQQNCFIGHTYAADWREALEAVCNELLPAYGLQPWYAYKYYDPTTTLRDKVVEMIAHSRFGIYDISYWRKSDDSLWEMPHNVLIESGMAIALNRPLLLLRHKENRIHKIDLPESLKSASQICEFGGGESTLKAALLAQLPDRVARSPEQDWQNRYCLFGALSCPYRETHPLLASAPDGKLSCHIADGPDSDQQDFRDTVEKVLEKFTNVTFKYLDTCITPRGYSFLVCAHCQQVRSSQFAIYRITPHTAASTFITIGMSIALEHQFGYRIPKLIITKDMRHVPSLLTGYDCVVVNNTYKLKSCLAPFVQQVIEKIHQTSYKPQPLPFEVFVPQRDGITAQQDEAGRDNSQITEEALHAVEAETGTVRAGTGSDEVQQKAVRKTGSIKRLISAGSQGSAYGFIAPDDGGQDIYFNQEIVEREMVGRLQNGMRVWADVQVVEGRFRALSVGEEFGLQAASYDFFISYHESDNRWADWITSQLQKAGYRIMKESLSSNTNIERSLLHGAEQAEKVVVLLSPDYLGKSGGSVLARVLQNKPVWKKGSPLLIQVHESGKSRINSGPLRRFSDSASFVDLTGLHESAAKEQISRTLKLTGSVSLSQPSLNTGALKALPPTSYPSSTVSPINILCYYSYSDEKIMQRLKELLFVLQKQHQGVRYNFIEVSKITARLKEVDGADIILLLVSSAFVDSDFCYSEDMERAIRRHEQGEITVIPVILRPALWEETPFGNLQVLPLNRKPVTKWRNRDDALFDITRGISEAIQYLQARK